jgi:uncharacterized protein YdaU (DUF1376 family)
MHYYQFNIGDYLKHTAHLTPMEDLAYRRLLDIYYDTETPIPNNIPRVSRLLRIDAEVVKTVLDEFFQLTEFGYKNHRADVEIAAYHSFLQKQKLNGIKGGRPKKTQGIAKPNPTETQNNPNQQPLTTNHKPNKLPTPNGVLESVWEDFVQQRKTKKALITETALKGIDREARKAGISLNDALQEICARGWTGFKAEWIVKDQSKKTEHQLRQDATARAIFGEQPVMEVYDVNNTRLLG